MLSCFSTAAAAKLESSEDEVSGKYGAYCNGLPEYTLEDVSKHGTMKDRVWVSYRHGVYDITDFIAKHPGKNTFCNKLCKKYTMINIVM